MTHDTRSQANAQGQGSEPPGPPGEAGAVVLRETATDVRSSPLVRADKFAERLAQCPPAADTRLEAVEAEDEFRRRAANHFLLRLQGKVTHANLSFVSGLLADRLLWVLVPRALRPKEWPRNEPEFARRYGITIWALRMWMRKANFSAVADKIGPFWTEEEVTKELVERLTERAFSDLENPDAAKPEPRYTELALKARKAIAGGATVNNTLTVTKNETNILATPDAAEVFKLVREVQQAAKELGMGEEVTDGAAPRAVEVDAVEVGDGESTAGDGAEK